MATTRHRPARRSAAGRGAAAAEPTTPRERRMSFGYTLEDLKLILPPMVDNGQGAGRLDGLDTPIAVLSERPQLLFSYFHQRFSQVTNPPIDPLRESLVMSLTCHVGREPRAGARRRHAACRAGQSDPHRRRAGAVRAVDDPSLQQSIALAALSCAWRRGRDGAAARSSCVRRRAPRGRRRDASLILSDRGVDADRAAIPSLLATSSVHQHWWRDGLRPATSLVIETGEAREVHHMALLVGFGAVGDQSVARHRDHRRARRVGTLDGAHGAQTPSSGIAPRWRRAAQDHLQDGHLARRLLLRRADLRGHRAGSRRSSSATSPALPSRLGGVRTRRDRRVRS